MSLSAAILGILILAVLFVMTFFVMFGQITVRKLRKNPETKQELGIELISGWDIINVAQSLAIPKKIIRKFRTTKLAFLYANADILHKHTNKFDRLLAACFYWSLIATALSTALWAVCDTAGLFD